MRGFVVSGAAADSSDGYPAIHGDLADQLRRCAPSILRNAADGAGKVARANEGEVQRSARGSAMESAAHLDVMKVEELVDNYCARALEILERVVALPTKMIDP